MPSTLTPRITCITTGLGTGGAEAMLCRLAGGVRDAGFSLSVISLTPGGKNASVLTGMGVPVQSLGMEAGRPSLGGLARLCRAVRRDKPDILAGWMYHGNLAATLARMAAGRRVPVIWNVRQSLYSLDLEKRGSALVIRALAPLSRLPAAIVYNSTVSARQHEKLGYRVDRTVIVPNGFDTETFAPSEEARASVRAELGLPPDALLVGRFGRHAAMKDYPLMIEAAARLRQTVPGARFIFAGTGVDARNVELTEQVKRLGLGQNVHLLGERHDLPRLTAALDLAVSSSAFGEGFPNVMGEAMACGVPCVATDVGDSAEVIGAGGRIVPAANVDALADACARILQSTPEQRRQIGAAGRRRIVSEYSLAESVRGFVRLFERELGASMTHGKEALCAA